LSCTCGLCAGARDGLELEFSCGGGGGGEISLPEVDLGVGIAVDTRSFGGSTPILLDSEASTVFVGAMMVGSRIVESEEDIEVNVERLEGVVGSTVGVGGTRTRATASSSKSVSVTIVGADILLNTKVYSQYKRDGLLRL